MQRGKAVRRELRKDPRFVEVLAGFGSPTRRYCTTSKAWLPRRAEFLLEPLAQSPDRVSLLSPPPSSSPNPAPRRGPRVPANR